MAEGFARAILGNAAKVSSAGTRPLHIDPFAIAVMRELAIDLRSHRSKSIDDFDAGTLDLVVIVCPDEILPAKLAHVPRLQWAIADPASNDPWISHEQMLGRFRQARDAIRRRVQALATEAPFAYRLPEEEQLLG
jgi:arsenate reductase